MPGVQPDQLLRESPVDVATDGDFRPQHRGAVDSLLEIDQQKLLNEDREYLAAMDQY